MHQATDGLAPLALSFQSAFHGADFLLRLNEIRLKVGLRTLVGVGSTRSPLPREESFFLLHGISMTCTATAIVSSFGGNDIVFRVDASCPESAGSITYDYTVDRSGAIGNPISRTCTWPRQLGKTSFLIKDSVLLGRDEAFHEVKPTQVACDCPENS